MLVERSILAEFEFTEFKNLKVNRLSGRQFPEFKNLQNGIVGTGRDLSARYLIRLSDFCLNRDSPD